MDQFVELLKQINIAQIFIIFVGIWLFYNRLDKRIEKNKDELKQEIQKNKDELKQEIQKNKDELKQEIQKNKDDLEQDIQRLSEKVEDVDRRLCRIEGSLAMQGHCLFSQAKPEQKAQ